MSRVSTKPNFYNEVNTMEARIASLERVIAQLTALNTNPDWITPTLINSWVNFGGGFEVAGYLKDPLGFVHLKGRITGGSGVAFILPADYRPGAEIYQCAISGSGLVGYYTLTTAGAFTPAPASGQADVSLAGITFLAEN